MLLVVPVGSLLSFHLPGVLILYFYRCSAPPVNNLTLILIPSPSFSLPFSLLLFARCEVVASRHSYCVHACRPQSLLNQHVTILAASFYLSPVSPVIHKQQTLLSTILVYHYLC